MRCSKFSAACVKRPRNKSGCRCRSPLKPSPAFTLGERCSIDALTIASALDHDRHFARLQAIKIDSPRRRAMSKLPIYLGSLDRGALVTIDTLLARRRRRGSDAENDRNGKGKLGRGEHCLDPSGLIYRVVLNGLDLPMTYSRRADVR